MIRKSKKISQKKIETKSVSKKDDSVLSKKTKISSKKKESIVADQKDQKKKIHAENLAKKQKAKLPEHIERIKRKESHGQPANKDRFYVTNAKLLEELSKMPKGPDGKILEGAQASEELGKMIMMIAYRLSNHSNFKNYSHEMKQDMRSYAHFKCIQGLKNYNFEYKNAFAYFTTACYNAFVSTISKYYKTLNTNREAIKRAIEKLESTENVNSNKILSQFLKEYLEEDPEKKSEKDQDNEEE